MTVSKEEFDRMAREAARYRFLRDGLITRQGERVAGGRTIQGRPGYSLMEFRYWLREDELDAALDKLIMEDKNEIQHQQNV